MLCHLLDNEASGGLVLMAAAALALVVANSPLAPAYSGALHAYLGPLSVLHWINDGLMAVFFLLVGLEIKREILDGQLATWPRRALPGIAAAGGMAVPALIYAAFNWGDPATMRGWAIPTATDIAFALGVLALLGPRVSVSLKDAARKKRTVPSPNPAARILLSGENWSRRTSCSKPFGTPTYMGNPPTLRRSGTL